MVGPVVSAGEQFFSGKANPTAGSTYTTTPGVTMLWGTLKKL